MLPQFLGKEVDDLITELLNPVCTIYLVCLLVHVLASHLWEHMVLLMYMYIHVMDVDMQCTCMYTYMFIFVLQSVEGSGGLLLSSDGPDLTGAYLLETLGLDSLTCIQ